MVFVISIKTVIEVLSRTPLTQEMELYGDVKVENATIK